MGGEAGATCSRSNGYCTQTCVCDGGCSMTCDGSGPPPSAPIVCDASYCEGPKGKFGGCSVSDDVCVFSVKCDPEGGGEVMGACP